MPPPNIRLAGGATETMVHPAVVVAMLVAIGLIFLLPRKYVVAPLLLIGILTPLGQVFVVGGVHFMVLRVVVLFALVRVFWTKVFTHSGRLSGDFNRVDRAFTLWAIAYAGAFVILWASKEALINRCGFLLDSFGVYFVLRFLIEDEEDVKRVIRVLALVAAVVALDMIGEQMAGRNVFGLYLGGVRSVPEVRGGQIRAQAVFQHAILAGSFGATLLPLFIGLWKSHRAKFAAFFGIVASTIITIAAFSSTPLFSYLAAIAALCFWPLRKRMRLIRWGMVVGLVALQLIMKADVWWAISHVHVVGGSSWHRASLIDTFIRHFGDWWLLGAKGYEAWGWDIWDVSNEFVMTGLNGGLVALVAFIAIISRSFGLLGKARRVVEGDRKQEWFLWCLGSALVAHVVAFFGTSYWDQSQVAWFALLAMISATTSVAVQSGAVQTEDVDQFTPLEQIPPLARVPSYSEER